MRLSPWYINTRRIEVITDTRIGVEATRSVADNTGERSKQMSYARQIAQDIVMSGAIPDLTEIAMQRNLAGERLLAGIWALVSFGGLSAAYQRAERGRYDRTGYIKGSIPLGISLVDLDGRLYTEHVFSFSSLHSLAGRKRAYIAGQFEIDDDGSHATIEPYIVGDFVSDIAVKPELRYRWPDRSRIYITQLREFAKALGVRRPTEAQLEVLRSVPEQRVKEAFAVLAGQPYVPKDWGGEKSDLYVNRLMLGSEEREDMTPVSAAFAFKGPAIFRSMHPADLGKRGDQLLRLFEEPADLMVLQHCHKIEPTVIRQMESLAARAANPKLYCVVDGADTYQVLKAYDYI